VAGIAALGSGRQNRGDAVVAIGAFENSFGEFFNEQRHTVRALDDLVDRIARKAGVAGEPIDQGSTIASLEPAQRQ